MTLSNPGAGQSVSGTATDVAGNTKSVTVNGINIDSAAPAIFSQVLSSPNQFGWYNAAGVTVRFTCTDNLSGLTRCGTRNVSGAPLSATDNVTVTTEGRNQTIPGTAIDRAGLSATNVSPAVSIDRTAPNVAITTPAGSALVGANARLRGTAFDALSGVRSVKVTYKRTTGNQTQVRDTTLTCNPNGNCTWEATLPSIGFWEATAQATDYAGNVSPPTAKVLISVN